MAEVLLEKARAKINLTLRVIGRRPDGYHDLESLVDFADLTDTLTLEPGDKVTLDVTGSFAIASGSNADNLVLKACAALRQRVAGLKGGRFQLEKNIPVAAGLGGGSADAAAALRLLARANGIALDDPRLAEAAKAVGADVPVCLASKPRIMRGVGDDLSSPLELPPLAAVLVNPNVALATRDVFAKFTGAQGDTKPIDKVPQSQEALLAFVAAQDNDLTKAAIACVPQIAQVLEALRAIPGARVVRMSGSGATCFALFASAGEAASAAWLLGSAHRDWWVTQASIG